MDRSVEDQLETSNDNNHTSLPDFEALLERYESKAYALARFVTGSTEGAEAVLTDVFVRSYEMMHTQSDPTALSTWLFSESIDGAIRHVNDARNSIELIARVFSNAEQGSNKTGAGRSKYEAVAQRLFSLPDEYKKVLLLHDVAGLPVSEIAPILEMSTFKTRAVLHRARLLFHRQIRKVGPRDSMESTNASANSVLARLPLPTH